MLSPNSIVDDALNDVGYKSPEPDKWLYMPGDPVGWIERHFYIPETNAPIVLEPYQRAVINEALRKDESGYFVYSLVLYSDLKKSAKSTIAAAVCLYLAWHNAWESVRIVANDLKQANSRTFYYIERAIRLNPVLNAVCKRRLYHIELPNNTTIDAIPVDPKGEAGGGDLVTCFTELWAFKNEAAKTLWSETTLSPLKFGKSLRWCESYAGFEGESPILEQLYESGVKQGVLMDVGIPGLELYRNEAGRMLTLWNTVPRCPWQTNEYYSAEAGVLTPDEFNRIHRNQWASSSERFIEMAWWHSSAVNEVPKPRSVIVACDAAVHDDCFAIVVVSREGDNLYVQEALAWKPGRGQVVDFESVKQEIARIASTYRIAVVSYDEYQLADMAQQMGRSLFWEVFPQGRQRAVADKQLYDLIREGRVNHGSVPILDEHLANANRKPEDENKLRIIKRAQDKKIDCVVALSMACYTALQYNI